MDRHIASRDVAGELFSCFDTYRENLFLMEKFIFFFTIQCREKEKTLLSFHVLLPPINIL